MVSTQDFAHQVWISLENIRERLAVLETELRYTRDDLVRLESSLDLHLVDRGAPSPRSCCGQVSGDHGEANASGITIKISRKFLGFSGGVVAVTAGAGKALGWW